MTFFSDIIKAAISRGFEPVRQRGKNIVMMYQCPQCRRAKMGKFLLKTDRRSFIMACSCGYRRFTKKAALVASVGSK